MQDAEQQEGRPKVVKMVSKLENLNEFLDAYTAFIDERSVVIYSRFPTPVGTRQSFSVHLKSGKVVLAGAGKVLQRDAPAGDKPVKMRLEIESFEPGSEAVYKELLARRRARLRGRSEAQPAARPRGKPKANGNGNGNGVPSNGSSAKASEQRAPGGEQMLPANPFSELTDQTLEGFIDCVLHEGTGGEPRGDQLERTSSAPAETKREVWVPPPQPQLQPQPIVASPPIHVESAPAAVQVRTGIGTHILVAILAAGAGVFAALFFLDSSSNDGARPAAKPPSQDEKAATPAPAPPTTNATKMAVDPPKPPSTRPNPKEAKPAEPKATEPAGESSCRLVLRSHDEAKVYIGRALVGTPPVDRTVPCGEVKITLTHPRYETYERTLQASPGVPLRHVAELQRPRVVIQVTSRPGGALLSVDGRIIGKAPSKTRVKAFTSIMVTASLDGYKPWSKRVRLTKSERITARLQKIPGAN